jgi:phosphoglycerate kinase
MPTPRIKSIRELNLKARTLFIRVDFNVPLSETKNSHGQRTITDDNRIREVLPTLQYAIEQGAKIILGSHLGRPDGKVKPEYTLEPVATHLATLLGREVTLTDDCIGEGIELMARNLKPGDVLLLENLRFHAEEEKNDPKFSRRLSRLAQIYVTDAFGTAHRKHASTYGLPLFYNEKGMGLLVEREIKFLDTLLTGPDKPFFVILGGSKVSDKIKTIESLMLKADGIVVGGTMAYAFMAAQDQVLPEGAKKPSSDDVKVASQLLRDAQKRKLPLLLPCDFIESFDIGPKTIKLYCEFLSKAKTIFWNGPLGWFEKPEYSNGTFDVARFVADLNAVKIVGGGDTVSAIHASGVANQFTHLSTGGGAVLEYLEGYGLPGIEVLSLPAIENAPFEFEAE